jgi:cytochrome c biogenesis protein CcmG, thiol:disulfide interchange protein DsbE
LTAHAAPPAAGRRAAALLVAALAVIGVLVVAVLGGGRADDTATVAGSVAVSGSALPRLDDPLADGAAGQQAPQLAGADYDGSAVSAPVAGRPTVLLFLAHWCPACQAEVPRVQDWIEAGNRPEDIALVAVSTGVDPDRDNHPPAAWLQRERWSVPTIVDDDHDRAAAAYGLPGYPFWVFMDAEGTVLGRHVGGLSVEQLEQLLERMREQPA